MKRDSTCLCRNIYTTKCKVLVVKVTVIKLSQASDGDRTRDTNLEGWDVTATPHSQKKTEISPQSEEFYHTAICQQEKDHPKYHP